MKLKIGWIVAGVVGLMIGSTYLYDVVQAKDYEFELVKTTSKTIVADGESTVRISVKLSKDNKPVEGHTIYIYASNGTLPSSRYVTDADGMITFRYYPYAYLNDELTPLQDVRIVQKRQFIILTKELLRKHYRRRIFGMQRKGLKRLAIVFLIFVGH